MSTTNYNPDSMTIELEGLETTAKALGNLKSKTPAAAKVAINATAREARKRMIKAVLDHYAVNSKGIKYVKILKQNRRATNGSLTASLYIKTPKNDLGYFETSPNVALMGMAVFSGPDYFTARVLKASPMKELEGTAELSKGFLVRFNSGHVGMVQRRLGSDISSKAKPTRWRTRDGRVEQLRTMGAPSASAMHHVVFLKIEPDIEQFLQDRLETQVERVIERAQTKKGK